MKKIVLLIIVIVAGVFFLKKEEKETSKPLKIVKEKIDSEELIKEEMVLNNDNVRLALGVFELEYFADRMVYKMKKVGYEGAVKETIKPGRFRVYINLEEQKAKDAEKKLLEIVPDAKTKIKKIARSSFSLN